MSKEIYISSTPHETRLAIVESDALTEIYYERENEYTLAGSIYNGKVTRVLPGMQSSFVDIGLERDAFLYITDFLEEEAVSDEFDSGGDAPARAPRAEAAGRDRGGRPDRNRDRTPDRNRDRGDRPAEPTAEPTDEELFTSAVSSLEAKPGDQPDRNRSRNGRNRGRDRGRDQARDPARDQARDQARDRRPEANRPEANRAPALTPAADDEASFLQPASTADTAELGEAAPGADGSRRWRGRRGRRGGRGPGFVPAAGRETAPPVQEADSSVDLYAAEAPAEPVSFEPTPRESSEPPARPERGPRNDRDRGRGDRGGRDRDRGGRDGRPARPSFAADPDTPVYGREVYAEAPAEPIILPGESLSKYLPASETAAPVQPAAASTTSLPPPSTEFRLVDHWDGGFVLPGESLSRRRTEPRTEPRLPSRPPQASQAAPAPVSHFTAPAPEPVAVEPVAAAPEPPQEYEPVEASASYKVDPVAPSEYRQSSPVIELEPEIAETTEIAEAPEIGENSEIAQISEAPSFAAAEPEPMVIAHEVTAHEVTAHEVTSIEPTGEMRSEAAPEAAMAAPVAHGFDASSGLHLEPTASPTLSEPAAVASSDLVHTTAVPPPPFPYFAPGSGDLEEEEMIDEEFELPSLQARAAAHSDYEEAEEETLEGAADLGTMLREMSIDEITGPAEEDEDDLEEDFLEEDQELGYDVDDEEPSEDELEADDDEAEDGGEKFADDTQSPELSVAAEPGAPAPVREPRRDGRNRGRDRNRSGRPDRSGGSEGGRRDGRQGRQSAQLTNLPAISDLLKPGQEILVQIAKEPIAKKGARITSHIALPGRFLVFMPTVSHTGVSRKIESDQERRRLKEILLSEKGDASGGFIVRTAAEGASEEELRSDLRFLLNLWTDIKNRSESSKSPALIYHDLNLVERVLRDQVTDNFSAIWVDTESQYEQVLRFLQRFQPSLIRRVKLYTKETPLFEQFGITEEINKALRSKVWLKSGGSIVINQTEALVAIDINTGKYVGKTARLEDTIVKTNLDAIPEIVRQIRLRDLGGIIIIDFIDMDERKNRNRVMAALEEELKSDRAPSKVLQFNDFGLVAITRKRVKQSLERTLSTTCGVCAGTGMVKSPVTVCNEIYVEMRKMHKHLDRGDVMLRVHPEVVKQLKAPSTHWLQEMEEMCGKTILVKSDPSLHPEQFDIH